MESCTLLLVMVQSRCGNCKHAGAGAGDDADADDDDRGSIYMDGFVIIAYVR